MENWQRTVGCGELRSSHQGQKVVLNGWVHRHRNHGGLLFISLRDRSGIVQVVFDAEVSQEAFQLAETLRGEYVVAVEGTVRLRPEGMINPAMATGEVEVVGEGLLILNPAKTPPIYIDERADDVDETLRLKYRYLDLRRAEMQKNLMLRHRVAKAARDFWTPKVSWRLRRRF